MTQILCDKCNKEIKYKEDLFVTTYATPFNLVKYHNKCYAQQKKATFFLIADRALNTNSYLYMIILSGIFAILILLFVLIPINPNFELLLYPGIFAVIIIWFVFSIPRIESYKKYE